MNGTLANLAIVHSGALETRRAAWMAQQLGRKRRTVLLADDARLAGRYELTVNSPAEAIAGLVLSLAEQVSGVVLLMSELTCAAAGLAFVQAQGRRPGLRLVPVTVGPCQIPQCMAYIDLAQIYGLDEGRDLDELDRVIRAGMGEPYRLPKAQSWSELMQRRGDQGDV